MWIPPAYSPSSLIAALRGSVYPHRKEPLINLLLDRFDGASVVLVDSGTSALRLAISDRSQARDRLTIALPAYGCYDLLTAAVGAHAKIRFYDVDPSNLNPDFQAMADAAVGADAIVVANLFGFPLDWDRIEDISSRVGVPVIEDAAQGLGTRWRDKESGRFGTASILSFGRGKGWTGGGGGALITRRPAKGAPDLPEGRGSSLKIALGTAGQWALARPSTYGIPANVPWLGLGETRYKTPHDPSRIHPAMISHVWATRDRAAAETVFRTVQGGQLGRHWDELGGSRPKPLEAGTASYLRLPLLVDTTIDKASHRSGIYAGYPMTLPDLAKDLAIDFEVVGGIEGARLLSRTLVTAPTHSRAPISRVSAALGTLANERRVDV